MERRGFSVVREDLSRNLLVPPGVQRLARWFFCLAFFRYGAINTLVRGNSQFDAAKSLEVLVYLAKRGQVDVYTGLKVLYLADKLHLERYGRLISGDRYKALQHGPVPQGTYDIIHYLRGEHEKSAVPHAKEALQIGTPHNRHEIVALRDPDLDELSESDRECLDDALRQVDQLSFSRVKALTHDAAYNATAEKAYISTEAIASTLPNAELVLAHLADSHPDK